MLWPHVAVNQPSRHSMLLDGRLSTYNIIFNVVLMCSGPGTLTAVSCGSNYCSKLYDDDSLGTFA